MTVAAESCCERHDRDYGQNGTVTRSQADRALRHCLAIDRPIFAWVVWAFVRMFGWCFWSLKK